jgi:hypothetical protein
MGKITDAQSKEFVQQKTDPKALAISNKFAEMPKKYRDQVDMLVKSPNGRRK